MGLKADTGVYTCVYVAIAFMNYFVPSNTTHNVHTNTVYHYLVTKFQNDTIEL